MKLVIFTDGACSGNPGPSAIGVVISRDGVVVKEIAKAIGEGTNNVAEYTAVIYALQEALILKAKNLVIKTDSELMARQLNGQYAVKNERIKQLFDQVKHLLLGFTTVEIMHVMREQNANADRLARSALKKANQDGRPSVLDTGEESPSSKG